MKPCVWEGVPAFWSPGEAWALVRGSWMRVHSADVGNSGRVLDAAAFDAKFPDLPPLPTEAFQSSGRAAS
jgi:hypothetical protein